MYLKTFSLTVGLLLLLNGALTADEAKQSVPFIFEVCPQWAFPGAYHDYYRVCFDRPVAPSGISDPYLWQIQAASTVKDCVMAPYLYTTGNNPAETTKLAAVFGKYIQASHQVPGVTVAPVLHGLGEGKAKADGVAALLVKLLQDYGDDPSWARLHGKALVMDYAHGGLSVADMADVKAQGEKIHNIIWITDAGSNIGWTVNGTIQVDVETPFLQVIDGAYNFIPPLDQGLGGYVTFGQFVRSFPDKIFGTGVAPDYYSSRLSQRNYVSARGTLTLRKVIEAASLAKPDFVEVATWNDYVEATSVEPTYSHTMALLDILRAYSDRLVGRPYPEDKQPHVVISYPKAVFAGQNVEFEVLNLPLKASYESLKGRIVLSDAAGTSLESLPFSSLRGDRIEAQTVKWTVPRSSQAMLVNVQVELQEEGGKQGAWSYKNLPALPVVSDSSVADTLFFNVPLYRLNQTDVRLLIDGRPGSEGKLSVASPRLLAVSVDAASHPSSVAYLKSGAVVNDPEPVNKPYLENWAGDVLYNKPVGQDYYGALVMFEDGTFAYSNDVWTEDPSAKRVWVDYLFREEDQFPLNKVGRDHLIDQSGRREHGTLKPVTQGAGHPPEWVSLFSQHDALHFDGIGSAVSFPLQSNPAGPITIELLIKPDQIGKRQIYIQRGATLSFALNADGTIKVSRLNEDRTIRSVTSATSIKAGEWSYLVATYDMNKVQIYINGKPDGEVAASGVRTTEGILLGGPLDGGKVGALVDHTEGDNCFKGDVARLRVLSGASTPDEVAATFSDLQPIYRP